MKHYTDMAIYIVTQSKEDAIALSMKIARELRMRSVEIESLLTAVHAVKKFGVDDDLIKSAIANIENSPEYECLKNIIKKNK